MLNKLSKCSAFSAKRKIFLKLFGGFFFRARRFMKVFELELSGIEKFNCKYLSQS